MSCADPVRAALVFLHLLEREANALGERRLRQAPREALQADVMADHRIIGIGPAHGHAASCARAAQCDSVVAGESPKGHAFELTINYTAKTKRLIAAIGKATPGA
jgi:hypothetical protein